MLFRSGTETKYGLIDETLNITDKGYVPTPTTDFETLSQTIYDIYLPCRDKAEGISMSLPGFIDVENGLVLGGAGAMKYRHDQDVARRLSERCGCKVVLENDGKAAALAEYEYGNLKGCRNAAVFVIGTGVGGGIIINGDILRGSHFSAGEFSFLCTEGTAYDYHDRMLGNRCSTTFLLKTYREKSGCDEKIGGREFFRRLPNDKAAQEALDELCTNIAVQVYNFSWLLDLEKVAIGGGISSAPELLEHIKMKYEEVKKGSFTGMRGFKTHTEIVPCLFKNDANLIGSYITYQRQSATR